MAARAQPAGDAARRADAVDPEDVEAEAEARR